MERNRNRNSVMLGQDADKAGFYVNASGEVVPVPSVLAAGSASVPPPPKSDGDVIEKMVVEGLKDNPDFHKLLELEVQAIFLGKGKVADSHAVRKGVTYLIADLPNLVKKAGGAGGAEAVKASAVLEGSRGVEFYNEEHIPSGPSGGQFAPSSGAPSVAPAGWQPDPTGRHTHRYWNGTTWTHDVGDNGVQGIDENMTPRAPSIPPPPGPSAPAAAASSGGAETRAQYLARINSAPTVAPDAGKKKGFFGKLVQAQRDFNANGGSYIKKEPGSGVSAPSAPAASGPAPSAPAAPSAPSRQERKLEEKKQDLIKDLNTAARRGGRGFIARNLFSPHSTAVNARRAESLGAKVDAIQQEQILAALKNK